MVPNELIQKVEALAKEAQSSFLAAGSVDELYQFKVKFLGKQGSFSGLMREMGKMDKEVRPAFGQLVNQKKSEIEKIYENQESDLKKAAMADRIMAEKMDLSLPGPGLATGHKHPLHQVMDDVIDILARIGFSVRTGPLIEKDWYNFEALNIPEDHPARDMQDTFYIDDTHVLRTHTSPVQIRTMENEKPPIRIIAPGSVFRSDSDISHSPNFHQLELLLIDEVVSMADLKGLISYFVKQFFGPQIKTRFRPSFFPFTEPSAEVDCSCPICKGKGCRVCKQTGWVEIGGSGLVNPKVLQFVGLDPKKYQGCAFGFGIERMAIIKYGINDIRLFNENNSRFLTQF